MSGKKPHYPRTTRFGGYKTSRIIDESKNREPDPSEVIGYEGTSSEAKPFLRSQHRFHKKDQDMKEDHLSIERGGKYLSDSDMDIVDDTDIYGKEMADAAAKGEHLFEGIRPGESWIDFKKRNRSELKDALAQVEMKERAELLKKKRIRKIENRAKRQKILGQEMPSTFGEYDDTKLTDFDQLEQDVVRFGEQAQRPPVFHKLPRGVTKLEILNSSKRQEDDYLTAHRRAKREAIDGNKQSNKAAKATTNEKQAMELMKQRIAKQYREMRDKRNAKAIIEPNKKMAKGKSDKRYKRDMNMPDFYLEDFSSIEPQLNSNRLHYRKQRKSSS